MLFHFWLQLYFIFYKKNKKYTDKGIIKLHSHVFFSFEELTNSFMIVNLKISTDLKKSTIMHTQ